MIDLRQLVNEVAQISNKYTRVVETNTGWDEVSQSYSPQLIIDKRFKSVIDFYENKTTFREYYSNRVATQRILGEDKTKYNNFIKPLTDLFGFTWIIEGDRYIKVKITDRNGHQGSLLSFDGKVVLSDEDEFSGRTTITQQPQLDILGIKYEVYEANDILIYANNENAHKVMTSSEKELNEKVIKTINRYNKYAIEKISKIVSSNENIEKTIRFYRKLIKQDKILRQIDSSLRLKEIKIKHSDSVKVIVEDNIIFVSRFSDIEEAIKYLEGFLVKKNNDKEIKLTDKMIKGLF